MAPWTAACQASLSVTNPRSLPKFMSIESVMPSNHLILCRPLLLLPSIFPSIRVFSDESALLVRWPNDWSFSLSISPFDECSGLISFRMDWLDLLAVQGTQESSPAPQLKRLTSLLATFPKFFQSVVTCSVFIARTSCYKTTHASDCYGARPGLRVSISVSP